MQWITFEDSYFYYHCIKLNLQINLNPPSSSKKIFFFWCHYEIHDGAYTCTLNHVRMSVFL